VVVAWLVAGVLLIAFELHHTAFYALFVAIGCVAAAVAALAGGPILVQVAVAAVVSLAGVQFARPAVRRRFRSGRRGIAARGVHGGLIGQQALTLDDVGPTVRPGHVRLTGERWLAISGGGMVIPAGTSVMVSAVEGTTLVVWPMDGPFEPPEMIGPTAEPEITAGESSPGEANEGSTP
jgi:membrane protein implicated in regulation of membrane protease activity